MQTGGWNQGSTPDPYAATSRPVHDYRDAGSARQAPAPIVYRTGPHPGETPYAPFLARFGAWLIDGVIIGAMLVLVWMAVALVGAAAGAVAGGELAEFVVMVWTILGLPLIVIVPLLYHLFLETGPAQATLGKQLLGLRLVNLQGGTISKGQSVGRYAVAAFLSGSFLGFGYLLALFTDRKQALHDLLANTVVLRR